MSDDPMDRYDEVIQMQLAEFQRHILGATNSDLVVIITEKNGVCQAATGSHNMSEAEGKGNSAALLSQVAAAMVSEGSDGRFELILKDKKTGEMAPAGSKVDCVVVKL